jgi:FAD dependent oxidoreductase
MAVLGGLSKTKQMAVLGGLNKTKQMAVLGGLLFLLLLIPPALAQTYKEEVQCSVAIAGGTTAALAAALSAAAELKDTGKSAGKPVCLLEPTSWPGGQLTAEALPAPDFAWMVYTNKTTNFTLNAAHWDRSEDNVSPNLWRYLQRLTAVGRCWVSPYCFPSRELLRESVFPELKQLESDGVLRVFLNTVVKRSDTAGDRVVSIDAVQRTPVHGVACDGYDVLPSADLADWYSEAGSERFSKVVLRVFGDVFIEATDWGELLALTGAPFLQGIDERFDGDTSGIGNDTCGQAWTFDFAESLHARDTPEPPNPYPVPHPDYYSLGSYSWDRVFQYRRILAQGEPVAAGDITIQNWGLGNDFRWKYLLLGKKATRAQAQSDWAGGIDVSVLQESEYHAFGWHYWFKKHAPHPDRLTLNSSVVGTCHGLGKLPYLRDTRRSIGIDDFVVTLDHIASDWISPDHVTGYPFDDRMAIGCYADDFHKMYGGCQAKYHKYMWESHQILPYFIPLRAMTNKGFSNLLVAVRVCPAPSSIPPSPLFSQTLRR